MILIRLKRKALKNNLTYWIVVSSSTVSPNGSQFIEKIGYYKPLVDNWSNKYLFVDFDRLKFWLERGARINVSLFVLLRGLLSLQSLSNWGKDTTKGSLYFYSKSDFKIAKKS